MSNFNLNKLNLKNLDWVKYTDKISYAPLDNHKITYVVRIAPEGVIDFHEHMKSEKLEIEILHFPKDGSELIIEDIEAKIPHKETPNTRLIHFGQKYEIRNINNKELYLISQFFPENPGTGRIKKHKLPINI